MTRKSGDLGVRYAYVAIFIALAVFYGFVLTVTIGWSLDSRKSVAAFFTIPVSLVLIGFAAWSRAFDGRFPLVLATGAFAFVPAIAASTWSRIETPIVHAAEPAPSGGLLGFGVTVALFLAIAGAAPHVIHVERGLDRVVRIMAPLVVIAEVAMFAVAIAHARRPDPDTFIASLPEPKLVGRELEVGPKVLREVGGNKRDSCYVVDEDNAAYTDSWGCGPMSATFDEVTGLVMVRKGTTWSSWKALRPGDIGHRLAAPVGWTHLAGGGALLASITLLLAYAFGRRARSVAEPPETAEGGYRVPAPMPADADARDVLRDTLEARARGARAVALTVAASTALPLAAALAHGLGR